MLHFDINWSDLARVAGELEASEKQIQLALHRALRRTEASLRRLSSKGLAQELQLRAVVALRNRLKSIKVRKNAYGRGGDGAALWYGLNDLPVSSFKGRPRSTAAGASFKGKEFDGAFVGRSKFKGKQTIFKRASAARLHIREQLLEIEDKAVVFIEDQVFDKVEEIFWQHFMRDIKARVKFRLGEY
jgi:hypothetical protein